VIPTARRLGIRIETLTPCWSRLSEGNGGHGRLTADDLRSSDPRFIGVAGVRHRTLVGQLRRLSRERPRARWIRFLEIGLLK
jgi:hypothetical protein